MLVIRLFRVGKKNQPAFKIVVTEKSKPPRGGVFIEEVGTWNPITKDKFLRKERIEYWMSVGAKPSASVHNLLVAEKIIDAEKIKKHKKPKKKKAEKVKEEALPSESKKEEGVGVEEALPSKSRKEETV